MSAFSFVAEALGAPSRDCTYTSISCTITHYDKVTKNQKGNPVFFSDSLKRSIEVQLQDFLAIYKRKKEFAKLVEPTHKQLFLRLLEEAHAELYPAASKNVLKLMLNGNAALATFRPFF